MIFPVVSNNVPLTFTVLLSVKLNPADPVISRLVIFTGEPMGNSDPVVCAVLPPYVYCILPLLITPAPKIVEAASIAPPVLVQVNAALVALPKEILPVPPAPTVSVPAVSAKLLPLIIDKPVGIVTVPPEKVLLMVIEGNSLAVMEPLPKENTWLPELLVKDKVPATATFKVIVLVPLTVKLPGLATELPLIASVKVLLEKLPEPFNTRSPNTVVAAVRAMAGLFVEELSSITVGVLPCILNEEAAGVDALPSCSVPPVIFTVVEATL